MSNDNSPENFAKHKRAVIVAPAGYGKTELIAQSVASCEGRQLVLTHTHAGVHSLRKRFKKYNIPSAQFNLETIHSFALKFAGSYPKTTQLAFQKPQENEEYDQVISSAINLFDIKLGKDILRYSYSGVFVDEYQDCQVNQHNLICKLADVLPCRIVGDPLQGIFDFRNTTIVDWETNVYPFFDRLPQLTIPHRWKNKNPELGERLKSIRRLLEKKEPINFRNCVNASHKDIVKFLKYTTFGGGNVYVICSPENESYPHSVAESLGNKFRTIEPLTSQKICEDAKAIESCCGIEKLKKVIEVAIKCLTSISQDCKRVLNFKKGNLDERQSALKEYFQKICRDGNCKDIFELFLFLENKYNPTYRRYQFWQEIKKSLYEVAMGNYTSLEEAAWHVRSQLRFKQNRIPKLCISRTVLLKGLECDHAVIIKPEFFDAKNLYVALTRASSKLTIISNNSHWSNYGS